VHNLRIDIAISEVNVRVAAAAAAGNAAAATARLLDGT